jgi:transposase
MDEARVGQKGRTCHRWWTRGQRPPGLCDQRYTWVHMMAAVQPATGEDFCLVMPEISTDVMNTFLAGFSATRAADEHALMVMDGAGWHRSADLNMPGNVSLAILPAYSPELNPIERIWLYLRERHLSHRLLDSYDEIVNACCDAWNKLTAERLQSLTNYPYLEQVRY